MAACFTKGLQLEDAAPAYAAFDWQWQVLATHRSGNPFFPLILNDFAVVFEKTGVRYFSEPAAREASREFYRRLQAALVQGDNHIEKVVADAMHASIVIWRAIEA
jgi:DNA-binding FadR family transcriptional regulator